MDSVMIYVSKTLGQKLKKLVKSKVGAVIAPAGYGKTTAAHLSVSDILASRQHWFTADKTNGKFDGELYDWFLSELQNIDIASATKLKKLGYFNRVNRYDIKNILKSVNTDEEHYIIIDNLQYITSEFADILISALASNECDNLRLIILAQYITPKQKLIFSENNCFTLSTQDLSLGKTDIKEFASALNINLVDKDIDALLQKTDGWVVFVALYLQKVKEFALKQTNIQDNIQANMQANSQDNMQDNMQANSRTNMQDNIQANSQDNMQDNIQANIQANSRDNMQDNIQASEGERFIISAEADINTLLGDMCWNKIDAAEKHFLLYFTFWQTMTYGCFLYISANDALAIDEERARSLMSKMPLIKFDSTKNCFTIHNLLRDFILLKFNDILADEKNEILLIAGAFEKEKGNNFKAVELFFKAKSYKNLLSCDMSGMLMENLDGVEFKEIALDVYKNCDESILGDYSVSALRLCYALYGAARFAEYEDFILKMQNIIDKSADNNLLGEWLLVSAFRVFPNVDKMTEIYKKAAKLMTSPSKIFTYKEPYLFGCTSMWYLFYSQVGQMESVADKIDKMIELYNTLTNGHAAGAEMLYRGEAYCVQGRFDEAEILVRTAARMAEVKKNVSVVYGAALILGIICVYKDNMIGLEEAIQYLENRATGYDFMQGTVLNKFMTETVRGYLLALLMETQDSSMWTREWTCSGTELTFTNFMAKTTQITDLVLHKEYKKAIANIEATLKLDKRLISLPTENFMRVGLALCYLAIGNLKAATQNLEMSLSLAEQDKNYTFLACFKKYLAILMIFPSVKEKHKVAIEEIKKLNLRYSIVRKKAIFDFILTQNSANIAIAELTERELEVANLAASGKRNKEIAKELFVSEYTVKNHLAVIYQKLNIDRRSRLIDMLK